MTDLTTRRTVLMVAGAVAAAPAASALPAVQGQTPRDDSDPRVFGAIGDGQFHALRTRFTTLAGAQQAYAFATSLDQSLDWAGIQSALNAAGAGRVLLRHGRYILSDPLALPNEVTFAGESRRGSILDNQNWPLHAPMIVNADKTAFLYVTIRDLTIHGGTHALKVDVTREVAGIVIDGITAEMQTEANLQFSSLQTTVIRDCHLMHGRHGLSVLGFPCNAIAVENCRIGAHGESSIRLRSADLFAMTGGSIEGGSAPGQATLDIETGGAYAQAITFRDVYFENTHAILLRSRGTGALQFTGCKFSGAAGGPTGLAPYRFDCGDDLIEFGSNHWDLPTQGPRNLMLTGRNDQLRAPGHCWSRVSARNVSLTSRAFTAGEAGRMIRLALGGPPSDGAHGWWQARLQVTQVVGAADGRRTVRRTTHDLLAEQVGQRLRLSTNGEGALHVVEQPDGRAVVIGATAGTAVEEVRFTLDSHPGGTGAELPVEVTPL